MSFKIRIVITAVTQFESCNNVKLVNSSTFVITKKERYGKRLYEFTYQVATEIIPLSFVPSFKFSPRQIRGCGIVQKSWINVLQIPLE